MAKCFFCELSKQKSKLIFKNKSFFCYYDDNPLNKGHCLIIPLKHRTSFFEFTDKEQKDLYQSIHKTKKIVHRKYKPDSYNIALNDGPSAGAIFDHICIHLIPRYANDTDSQIGTGARAIMGFYSSPASPPKKFSVLNRIYSEKELSKLRYSVSPNKKFFLGLKAIITNEKGQILSLIPLDSNKFQSGRIDLPGGRCENRDKEEIKTIQREVSEEIDVNVSNIMFFDKVIMWDVAFNAVPTPVGLILFLYTARFPYNAKIKLKKKEHKTYKWLWPTELAERLVQFPQHIREKIKLMEMRD